MRFKELDSGDVKKLLFYFPAPVISLYHVYEQPGCANFTLPGEHLTGEVQFDSISKP